MENEPATASIRFPEWYGRRSLTGKSTSYGSPAFEQHRQFVGVVPPPAHRWCGTNPGRKISRSRETVCEPAFDVADQQRSRK
jgi:hypothetical protein